MIYKLYNKNSDETKNRIDAKTKKLAIEYFAAIMHLNKRDLLNIYKIN